MNKMMIVILMTFLLSGCQFFLPKKPTIEQGNIITPAMVSQLHRGQSQAEVRGIMGNPVLLNILTPERLEYVYTIQKEGPRCIKRVTLVFRGDSLVEIYTLL